MRSSRNRLIGALLLISATALGSAASLLVDDFSVGFSPIVKPGAPDYTPVTVDLGQDLLGLRGVGVANFQGGSNATFTVSDSGGLLTAQGASGGSGLMQLGYNERPNGFADLSTARAVTFDVAANSAPLTGYLGFYSNGYANYSNEPFTLATGETGRRTLLLSDLTNDPLIPSHVDSMFLVFNVGPDATLSLDRLSVEAVPEPLAGTALLAGLAASIARRKRWRNDTASIPRF